MSSILYVADLTPGTRSHQVTTVPLVRTRRDAQHTPPPRLRDRLARRLGLPADRAGANARLRRRLESKDFDALWVEQGLVLRPETLACAKRLQPELELIHFSEDDLFLRHNQSRWLRQGLSVYDLVVTTKRRNADPEELPTLGAVQVHYEPKTFDPAFHRPLALSDADRERFGCDVGFIGTFESARARACLALAEAGIEVRVFGNGWQRFRRTHPKLRVERRPLSGLDYIKGLCASRIQLGFLRQRNRDEHSDRSVEVPACGVFLLAERTQEHLELFAEGREASYFTDPQDLIGKTIHYLTAERERERIAAAGRRRCLESDYSHHGACARILARCGIPSPVAPRIAAQRSLLRAETDFVPALSLEAPAAPFPAPRRQPLRRSG
jgi:spore maturation protein CgeB